MKANTPTPKSANGKNSRIDPSQIPRPVKPADGDGAARKLQKPKNETGDENTHAMSMKPEEVKASHLEDST